MVTNVSDRHSPYTAGSWKLGQLSVFRYLQSIPSTCYVCCLSCTRIYKTKIHVIIIFVRGLADMRHCDCTIPKVTRSKYESHQLHHNIPSSQLVSLFAFQSCLSLDSDSPSLKRGKKNQDKANVIWSLVPIISMH